jgi:hypothetical protein
MNATSNNPTNTEYGQHAVFSVELVVERTEDIPITPNPIRPFFVDELISFLYPGLASLVSLDAPKAVGVDESLPLLEVAVGKEDGKKLYGAVRGEESGLEGMKMGYPDGCDSDCAGPVGCGTENTELVAKADGCAAMNKELEKTADVGDRVEFGKFSSADDVDGVGISELMTDNGNGDAAAATGTSELVASTGIKEEVGVSGVEEVVWGIALGEVDAGKEVEATTAIDDCSGSVVEERMHFDLLKPVENAVPRLFLFLSSLSSSFPSSSSLSSSLSLSLSSSSSSSFPSSLSSPSSPPSLLQPDLLCLLSCICSRSVATQTSSKSVFASLFLMPISPITRSFILISLREFSNMVTEVLELKEWKLSTASPKNISSDGKPHGRLMIETLILSSTLTVTTSQHLAAHQTTPSLQRPTTPTLSRITAYPSC